MEGLEPRHYQTEILEKAINGNVIAWLDTGSGKTYIAVMLIRWMTARSYDQRKVIIFLANTVGLVYQQAAFIKEHTELEVRPYSGRGLDESGVRVDSWNSTRWTDEFNSADVLVFTPALFQEILTHGFWSIRQVSLLILDEAHHCMKGHPYNQIMRSFYFKGIDHSNRPKIFGMTASPVWNGNQGDVNLRTLEKNMDSIVQCVRKNVQELEAHAYRPNERLVIFSANSIEKYANSLLSLWNKLDVLKLLEAECFQKTTLYGRYTVAVESLGLYGADQYLYSHLLTLTRHLNNNLQLEQRYQEFGFIAGDKASVMDGVMTEKDSLKASILQIEEKLTEQANQYSGSIECFVNHSSPKFRKLIDILRKQWTISTGSFQGIIFVSQRHIATSLCWMLTNHPDCSHWLRPAPLMGHGEEETSSFAKGMSIKEQNLVRQQFRDKIYNLLIATSVAEEGLDFPECDLIVRFDGLQHMIGYMQSRGRARKPNSSYVVMLAEHAEAERKRYQTFVDTEASLKQRQALSVGSVNEKSSNDCEKEEEPDDPRDFELRETFEIASTGAKLTYDTAIALLARYCSTIPRDRFTPALKPVYRTWLENGLYKAYLSLPPAIPIDPNFLVYSINEGRHTKREAIRAVAFDAVCELHSRFKVFDDNLLPFVARSGTCLEDADGVHIKDVRPIPEKVQTEVVDPWHVKGDLFLYPIFQEGGNDAIAGLVTSAQLNVSKICTEQGFLHLGPPSLLPDISCGERQNYELLMSSYTRFCLNYIITSRPIVGSLVAYVIPVLMQSLLPDYELMKKIPRKSGNHWLTKGNNWDFTARILPGMQLMENVLQRNRPLLFLRIRHDLTVASDVLDKILVYGRHNMESVHRFSDDENLVEVQDFQRVFSSKYSLEDLSCTPICQVSKPFHLPYSTCSLLPITPEVFTAYRHLPPFMQRLTDIYRASKLVSFIRIPELNLLHVVEALTLPSSGAGFSNQRLETLGDAVLKIAVVVHVYHKYPSFHEGQLTALKVKSISNKTLLSRGYSLGLPSYMTVEVHNAKRWRLTDSDLIMDSENNVAVKRMIPRRSIQDCMESLLGAAFCSAGLPLAMKMGTRLGLSFGGEEAWNQRYAVPGPTPSLSLFKPLENILGYQFKCSQLLREALTHPTFESIGVPSYQRLELLGDALIDMVVTEHIFNLYPQATPGQLTWMRSRSVCAPSLTLIAIRELHLHKYLLYNSPDLGKEIAHCVNILDACSYEDMATRGWKYDPPKVISDLTESVLGAMFIDSSYNYEFLKLSVLRIFRDLLAVITPDLPKDPSAELLMWVTKNGCRKCRFRKCGQTPDNAAQYSYTVSVHDKDILPPVQGVNFPHSKCLAAEQALALLSDESGHLALGNLCSCPKSRRRKNQKKLNTPQEITLNPVPTSKVIETAVTGDSDTEEERIVEQLLGLPRSLKELDRLVNTETQDGFAVKGLHLLDVLEENEAANDAHEEAEVEKMLID